MNNMAKNLLHGKLLILNTFISKCNFCNFFVTPEQLVYIEKMHKVTKLQNFSVKERVPIVILFYKTLYSELL
jgi:hypothetical protein